MQSDITNNEVYQKLKEFIEESFMQQIKQLKDQLTSFSDRITELEKEKVTRDKELKDLQRDNKRNNLIIFGLPEIDGEDLYEKVLEFFNKVLKIETYCTDINYMYRFGKEENRPIVVKFISLRKKIEILKNCYLLQGSTISLTNDLIKEDREVHKILQKHKKIAKSQNKKVIIKNNLLIINDVRYTVEDLLNTEKKQASDKDEQNIDDTEKNPITNSTKRQETREKVTRSKTQNIKGNTPINGNYSRRGPTTSKKN